MAAGWVDTDRGAFSRYKSVWLLSTTQQLITLGLGAGKQRSPIQPNLHTHRHVHRQSVRTSIDTDAHTLTVSLKLFSAQAHADVWKQVLISKILASQFVRSICACAHRNIQINTHVPIGVFTSHNKPNIIPNINIFQVATWTNGGQATSILTLTHTVLNYCT